MNRPVTSSRTFTPGVVTALILAAAPGLIPFTAAAAEPTSIRVRVSDLDLASAEGQRTLVRRVDAAIDKVCARAVGNINPAVAAPSRIKHCRQEAEADVRRQLAQHGLPPTLVASR